MKAASVAVICFNDKLFSSSQTEFRNSLWSITVIFVKHKLEGVPYCSNFSI